MQVYAKRYTILQLKIRKNKSFHEKRTAHWYIANSVLLKSLKQRLIDITSFEISKSLYSRSVLNKRTNNFRSVFANRLDRRIYKTKFPTHVSFFFQLSICRITVTFPSMLKTFLLFVTVPILSYNQSPINCSTRNPEGNCKHTVNYCYYCHFPGLEFM
jgi:hypothetical protein